MYFDTHAHVNFSAFKSDGEEVLRRAFDDGISVVNVGSQYSTSQRAIEYAHKFDNPKAKPSESEGLAFSGGIYAAVGIHPGHLKKGNYIHNDPDELDDVETRQCLVSTVGEKFDREKYLELAKDEKVVAIGEIGLDYHHFEPGDNIEELKKIQQETLIKFIELANVVDKPVMLHCWGVKSRKNLDHARTGVKSRKELNHVRTDAYADLLEILKTHPVNKKGIVHSFVGSYKTAQQFIEMGYVIGINGIATYSESYDKLIRETPLESIVLETDCPYLAPANKKGERNEPLFVKLVAEKIASVKGISIAEVAEITTENAKNILGV